MIKLQVKKLEKDVQNLFHKHEGDAGRDIHAYENAILYPGNSITIDTKTAIKPEFISNKQVVVNTLPDFVKEKYMEVWDIIDLWFMSNFKIYIQVSSRSGLASKEGISVIAGIIDEGYIGSIKVVLVNNSKKSYKINKGDRIGQLIVKAIPEISLEYVDDFEDEEDIRGKNGFGSTGK